MGKSLYKPISLKQISHDIFFLRDTNASILQKAGAIFRKFGPRCLTSKSQNPSFIYDIREGIFPKETARVGNPS